LWFAHWETGEIVAGDLDGNSAVVGDGPPGVGWSIGWLPDGRLLTTGEQLTRQDANGERVVHADLTGLARDWNELNACVRVREDGEVLERIELDRSPFACMLGGPDGRTLFVLAA
jgi:hypothetical protein